MGTSPGPGNARAFWSGDEPEAARRLRVGSYLWRREPRASGRGRRRWAIAASILGYLALCSALVWVLLWLIPPRPAALVLVGAGYETNLAVPENVFGRATLRALAALARRPVDGFLWTTRKIHVAEGPKLLKSGEDFQSWKALGSRSEPTLLIYLAAHGVVDDKLGPCLLADDATGLTGRVPLKNVLEALREPPLDRKKKVLVLDATQVVADWHQGALSNEFARVLKQLDPTIAADPNLVVISSTSPGQRSWPDPESGQSAFGRIFLQGLAGEAGKTVDPITNELVEGGQVTALELFEYVDRGAREWASSHFAATQEPLLLPTVDGRERASRIDLVSGVALKPLDRPVTARTGRSAGLIEAWRDSQTLLQADPHPASYAPHLLNAYLGTLLRCDVLERSGDPDSAQGLFERLAALKKQLAEARSLPLGTSSSASLTIPAVEGVWPIENARPPAELVEEMWRKGDDRAGTWRRIGQSLREPRLRELRSQFYDLGLRRVEENPLTSFDRAVDLFRAVDDPSRPRPSEVEDLLIYGHINGPLAGRPEAYAARIVQAVRVRSLAERAALGIPAEADTHYPFSERVEPWFRHHVEEGDRRRRVGQDLLFATDPKLWDEAGPHFDAAKDHYTEALKVASVVREALATRDTTLAILPYYSRWLSRRPDADDTAVSEAETLWRELHGLVSQLEDPPIFEFGTGMGPRMKRARLAGDESIGLNDRLRAWVQAFATAPRDLRDEEVAALGSRLARVKDGFAKLQERFRKAVKQGPTALGPRGWEAVDALLSVPFFELEPGATPFGQQPERLELSGLWLRPEVTQSQPTPNGTTASAATDRVRREGTMALATLGADLYDSNLVSASEGELSHAEALRVFSAQSTGGEAEAIEELKAAVSQVGGRVGRLFGTLATGRADDSRPTVEREDVVGLLAPARGGRNEGRDDTWTRLRRANRYLRQLDGAGADRIARYVAGGAPPGQPVLTPEHLTALRRTQAQALLLRQSKRVEDDHWYRADDRAESPYYRSTGLSYVADARRLTDKLGLPPNTELDLREASLRKDDALELKGPASLVVTSERQVDLSYEVTSVSGDPPRPGVTFLWADPPGDLTPVAPAPGARVDVRLGVSGTGRTEAPPSTTLRCELADRTANEGDPGEKERVRNRTLTVHGLFRGHRYRFRTDLELHRAADAVAAQRARPDIARVAVRTNAPVRTRFGMAQGAVAFVVDASGSMGPPEGQAADANTKYAVAIRALERVLAELPQGLVVSVYVFGAARAGYAPVPPEETIDTVFGPGVWGPGQSEKVMNALRALEPWNESPIVRTILRARSDLLAIGRDGVKSIVVITDGDDNRFEKDTLLNPGAKSIPEFLASAFSGNQVQLNVIGFRAPDVATEARLRDQFRVVETLGNPGRFYYVDDVERIELNLKRMVKQTLEYRLLREDATDANRVATSEIPVGRMDIGSGWTPAPLSPGGYLVELVNGPRATRPLTLTSGDQLILSFLERDGGVSFAREWCPPELFPGRQPVSETAGDWRLTAYAGGLSPDRELMVYTTLERDPARDAPTIRLPRPSEVLIELAPEESNVVEGSTTEPVRYRWADWTTAEGFPAAAWTLRAPRWPTGNADNADGEPPKPVLHAWWLDKGRAPASAVLSAGKDFVLNASSRPGPILIANGVEVGNLSVTSEEHEVEISPGATDRKTCLVVRFTHPSDRRLRARLGDLPVAGQEHRFYESSKRGHYTGLFWTKTPDETLDPVKAIELVEDRVFKATCERARSHVRLVLPPPLVEAAPVPPAPIPERR